jgi:hypothetical protein
MSRSLNDGDYGRHTRVDGWLVRGEDASEPVRSEFVAVHEKFHDFLLTRTAYGFVQSVYSALSQRAVDAPDVWMNLRDMIDRRADSVHEGIANFGAVEVLRQNRGIDATSAIALVGEKERAAYDRYRRIADSPPWGPFMRFTTSLAIAFACMGGPLIKRVVERKFRSVSLRDLDESDPGARLIFCEALLVDGEGWAAWWDASAHEPTLAPHRDRLLTLGVERPSVDEVTFEEHDALSYAVVTSVYAWLANRLNAAGYETMTYGAEAELIDGVNESLGEYAPLARRFRSRKPTSFFHAFDGEVILNKPERPVLRIVDPEEGEETASFLIDEGEGVVSALFVACEWDYLSSDRTVIGKRGDEGDRYFVGMVGRSTDGARQRGLPFRHPDEMIAAIKTPAAYRIGMFDAWALSDEPFYAQWLPLFAQLDFTAAQFTSAPYTILRGWAERGRRPISMALLPYSYGVIDREAIAFLAEGGRFPFVFVGEPRQCRSILLAVEEDPLLGKAIVYDQTLYESFRGDLAKRMWLREAVMRSYRFALREYE